MKDISCLEVFPNHDKKSAIVTYVETTVKKAMELATSVPADIAEELLSKAVGFVGSRPKDSVARETLLRLLLLRAALPSASRRGAVQQLLSLVAEDPEKSAETVAEVLANFESWEVALHLGELKDDFVDFLQASARGPPVLPCAEMLERELAGRWAQALERERGLADAKPKQKGQQLASQVGSNCRRALGACASSQQRTWYLGRRCSVGARSSACKVEDRAVEPVC